MNIFSKAALFFMMATNLTNVSVVSANDEMPTLRGATQTQSFVQEEITPEVKLDAFVALMEARRGANYCFRQMGCNTPGYDYCLQRKHRSMGCGSCDRSAAGGLGRCTSASVDLDMELDVVSKLSHDELLDMAAIAMEDYHLSEQEFNVHSAKRIAQHNTRNAARIANKSTQNAAGIARHNTRDAAGTAKRHSKKPHWP